MYNSREIGELRADVAVNCRTLIELSLIHISEPTRP